MSAILNLQQWLRLPSLHMSHVSRLIPLSLSLLHTQPYNNLVISLCQSQADTISSLFTLINLTMPCQSCLHPCACACSAFINLSIGSTAHYATLSLGLCRCSSISVARCGIGASLHCFMACFMPDYMLKAQVPLPRNEHAKERGRGRGRGGRHTKCHLNFN